jgi:nucleotide-binding universal stress UspA family protein
MEFRNVVAAIDIYDELAKSVILTAEHLARRDDAALYVVSAWSPLKDVTPAYAADLAPTAVVVTEASIELDKRNRTAAEKKLKELARESAPDAQVMMFDGDPANVIPEIARKTGADVIVAGSHQKGFWSALFTGGASRALIHDAPCAVFLVTKAFAEKVAGAATA